MSSSSSSSSSSGGDEDEGGGVAPGLPAAGATTAVPAMTTTGAVATVARVGEPPGDPAPPPGRLEREARLGEVVRSVAGALGRDGPDPREIEGQRAALKRAAEEFAATRPEPRVARRDPGGPGGKNKVRS